MDVYNSQAERVSDLFYLETMQKFDKIHENFVLIRKTLN